MGADIVAFAQAETLCSATEAWSDAEPPGFALTARYFFLSCQEEVPKKKARPLRRPATPGALRCSVATGGCATRPFGAQTVLALFPVAPCAARRRRGQDQHRSQFLAQADEIRRRSPCRAPSNAGQPGDVGEHCLSPAGASCAAARLNKSRREVGVADRRECSADRGAGGRLFFRHFLLATQKKVTRRQGGAQRLRFLATLGMTAHPPSRRNPSHPPSNRLRIPSCSR